MRKALIPAFLLVVTAIVLGSTVFREQIAHAATTPFQQVVVQNTSTNPVPVKQIGTSTTNVTGTVGIDSSQNTVKLDSGGNTVNLDSTDSGHLANIENDLGNLKFDTSGNLETTAQTASPGAVREQCTDGGSSAWIITHGSENYPLCSGQDFYATDVTASGMDDNMVIDFLENGNIVLELLGSGINGADSYQLDLTHPIHVDEIDASCNNGSSACDFSLAVLGNSTGN
ncbi:MAG TPA: hypothetical protein VGM45_08075 [Gaiellaceae bacterium]|jgi:hypothetical protein